MHNCQVTLVMAVGNNGQVGLKNKLPWNIPEELKHFKELTHGHAVIMGRNTFESIGKPLGGRQNIVISSKMDYLPGFSIARSLDEALEMVEDGRIGYVIGGVNLWDEAADIASSAVITLVDYDGESDANIPKPFFEKIKKRFKLSNSKDKDGYTLTEWIVSLPKPYLNKK